MSAPCQAKNKDAKTITSPSKVTTTTSSFPSPSTSPAAKDAKSDLVRSKRHFSTGALDISPVRGVVPVFSRLYRGYSQPKAERSSGTVVGVSVGVTIEVGVAARIVGKRVATGGLVGKTVCAKVGVAEGADVIIGVGSCKNSKQPKTKSETKSTKRMIHFNRHPPN